MSQRNVRKLFGGNTLPPPSDDSEEEYVPLCSRKSAPRYQGLELSSNSEPENESNHAEEENEATVEIKKKKNKKNKKRKQKKIAVRMNSKEIAELDEIDKSIMEVNAMLGEPIPRAHVIELPKRDPEKILLECAAKHLNVEYELKRLFGPEENEEGGRRRRRQQQQQQQQHNQGRSLRKPVIVPVSPTANYQKIGLSMSIIRREENATYYAFDHNRDYQRIHREFLLNTNYRATNMPIEEPSSRNLHVESLLESADSMFRVEEYTTAKKLVEETIAYMQHVAHPSFNLTNVKTRLEYAYLENRPFHVAVLKYLHMLTNRACHRTALELAKLLLNLDPSDPLAVLFIIDTIALRAREHQWLIDAVLQWNKKRDARFLFNLQYSFAMAQFHVARKIKDDLKMADYYLQKVMLRFPTVAMKITDYAGAASAGIRLQNHPLFTLKQDETTTRNIKELIQLYAKLTCSRWREPPVYEWLTRNMYELAEKYDNDSELREHAKELADENYNLFRGWPAEIVRHMHVIRPMSLLLVEGAVPRGGRCRSSDPAPAPRGINRNNYETAPRTTPRNESRTEISIAAVYGILQSLYPGIDLGGVMERYELGRVQEGLPEEELNVPGIGFGAAVMPPPPPPPPPPAPPADDNMSSDDDNDGPEEHREETQTVLSNNVRLVMDLYNADAVAGVAATPAEREERARARREAINGTQIDPDEDDDVLNDN